MRPRYSPLLAGTVLVCALAWSATAASAATLTTSFATWASNVGAYASTSSTGLPLYSTTTVISLASGGTLGTGGDTVLAPLSGWGPWSGGYAGDIFNTVGNAETLTFGPGLAALGLDLSPDVPLQGPYAETFTVSLSDGSTVTLSGSYPPGTTGFVGFYGGAGGLGGSMTITASIAPDFAFGDIRSAAAAVTSVPEPTSAAALGSGVIGLALRRRRNCRAADAGAEAIGERAAPA